MPCGRFFHSAKATFHQPPQHLKQEYSFIPFHKSYAIALRVLADASLHLLFCVRKLQNNANAKMHLLNPLQAPCYFVHSIQSHTCPAVQNLNILLKETKYACGRFFHSDAFRSGRSLLASAPDPYTPLHLHSISHLRRENKSASHPCLIVLTLIIQLIQHSVLFYKALSINPKNKKESKSKWLAIGLQG